MNVRKRRWLGVGLATSASAGFSAAVLLLNAASASADDIALIMSGTGSAGGTSATGSPTEDYLDGVFTRYIDPAQPYFSDQIIFPGFEETGLATPEQDWPFTGLDSLTLDQSIAEGVDDLNTAITQTYAGDDLVVLGYSQSATIATLEMKALIASGQVSDPNDLHFVLIGDPDNPESGIYSLQSGYEGVPYYYTTTPADTPYATDIYTIQYDGYSDFCQYPIDIVCDINAGMGMDYDHLEYSSLSAQQLSTAVELPTDGGDTTYYLIPSETLPLLEPLYQLEDSYPILEPVVTPIIDLTQPDLTYLVDIGYEDPYTTDADITATTSLFPDVSLSSFTALGQDTVLGVDAVLAYEGLPALPQIGDGELSGLLGQLNPSLSTDFDELSNLLGPAATDLYPIMDELSAGPVGEAVTELGVGIATVTSLLF